jgi:hypothetical protein
MSCRRNSEVLRLVSGELDDVATQRLREHLAECAACAAAYDDARHVWRGLGDWRVDAVPEDLTTRVLQAIEDIPLKGRETPGPFDRMGFLRAAAAIALAVGLGIYAGTLLPTPRAVPAASDTRGVVMESLGLADLGLEGSTGLTLGFEPEPSTGTAGGVP